MSTVRRPFAVGVLCLTLASLINCSDDATVRPDHPRLSAHVVMRDVLFHSAALDRDMRYRVLLPASIESGRKLPVVYLLHGAGADFREWSDDSDVARFGERGMVLVMPQGDYSYYVNAAGDRSRSYEDYIVQDLLAHAEAEFPIAKGRATRAIIGVSMGGFGAINIALRHPDLFVFAGALSPAIDVARRQFSIRRVQQSWSLRSIFGPWGSEARRQNDPFLLVGSVAAGRAPYVYVTCGTEESLFPSNRAFAAVLAKDHVPSEFHSAAGGHDWTNWNRQLPVLFTCLRQHVGSGI